MYKALMSDVGGTLVPYDYNALPSPRVAEAIKKAQKIMPISLVTGRGYHSVKPILRKINLTEGFAVLNNGSYVIDIKTDELIYERYLSRENFSRIAAILDSENVPFFLKQSHMDTTKSLHHYTKKDTVNKASMIFAEEIFAEEIIERILKQLSGIPDLAANKQHHKHQGKFGISICHAEATKLHGIYQVAKRLNLEPQAFIGVGDSYNDFPLLMACGLKVAMGNAVPDLKAIADHIAPAVEDDGVAEVIEKFILKSN